MGGCILPHAKHKSLYTKWPYSYTTICCNSFRNVWFMNFCIWLQQNNAKSVLPSTVPTILLCLPVGVKWMQHVEINLIWMNKKWTEFSACFKSELFHSYGVYQLLPQLSEAKGLHFYLIIPLITLINWGQLSSSMCTMNSTGTSSALPDARGCLW